MSDIKISQLPQSTQLTGSEIVPMDQVQGGNLVTVKTTAQDIANLSSLGYTAENVANKSTDNTFYANSDTLYPSQKATKTYVDAVAVGLLRDNGNYDPTVTSNYPTSANTLSGGNVQKGDIWYISVNGTINANAVLKGYSVRALVDNAGATNNANWSISNVGLGYIPENVEYKSTDVNLGTSDTLYPTQNAVKTYVDAHLGVPTLQEVLDNNHQLSNNNNFQGTEAGGGELFGGAQVNAFGYQAAYDNTESNINAFGSGSAKENSGSDVNAFGNTAANSNTGNYVNAFGSAAADSNNGDNLNAFGVNAGMNNTGNYVNAFGYHAGSNNSYNFVNIFGSGVATSNNQTVFAGATYSASLNYDSITANREYTFPDKDGTLATTDDVSGWGLLGNAGTDSSVNFIGTTDSKDLVFKRNGNESFRINSDNDIQATYNIKTVDTINGVIAMIGQDFATKGYLMLGNGTGIASVQCTNLSGSRILELPDKDGTLATTDDVGAIQRVKVSLTSADILALNFSTPFTLIAAPGTGKYIDVISLTGHYIFNTIQYSGNTSVFYRIGAGSLGGIPINSNVGTANVFNQPFNTYHKIIPYFTTSASEIENKPLIIDVGVGAANTGQGTLDVYITYSIVTL